MMQLARRIGTGLAGICLAFTFAGPSVAAPGDCGEELDGLKYVISSATSFTNPVPDQNNLLNKVEQARAKVDLDKCSDALDKLNDIDAKVTDLSDDIGKKKLGVTDAAAILDASQSAAICIGPITTCVP